MRLSSLCASQTLSFSAQDIICCYSHCPYYCPVFVQCSYVCKSKDVCDFAAECLPVKRTTSNVHQSFYVKNPLYVVCIFKLLLYILREAIFLAIYSVKLVDLLVELHAIIICPNQFCRSFTAIQYVVTVIDIVDLT